MDEFIKAYYAAQTGLYVNQIVNNFKYLKANLEKEVSGVMKAVALGVDGQSVELDKVSQELERERTRFGEAMGEHRVRLRLVKETAEMMKEFLGMNEKAKAKVLEKIFSSFLLEYLFKLEMSSSITFMRNFQGKGEHFMDAGLEKYQNCREIAMDLANNNTEKLAEWCRVNRSKLRRAKSGLEFKVHTREFYQLAITGRTDKEGLLEFVQTQLIGLTSDLDSVYQLVEVLMTGDELSVPRDYSIASLSSEFCRLYFEIEGFNKNYFLENLVCVS